MTENEVASLLRGHGLPCVGATKSAVGFRNEVWLTDGFVVKLYGNSTVGGAREQWFYRSVHPVFAPALAASG